MRLLGLDFAGRRVLVVGAGAVGARKALDLMSDGAEVVVVAPQVDAAVAQTVTVHRREVVEADLDGVWLVVAATDSADVNAHVARWAAQRRIWCVNASDAAAGSARNVAQVRQDDALVGVVSITSPDPRRSAMLRDGLARVLAQGDVVAPRQRQQGSGRVVLVGAGPGAADLITVRGRRAVASADVVVHDRLGTAELLASLPESVERIDVGKRPDHHPVPQEQINALLVEHALAGRTVVRLKGGDPFVLGRGGEEFEACVKAGVAVEVVPGLSSALAGPALAGIPVTDRAVTAGVLVASGHAGLDAVGLEALGAATTVVLLMGVAALEQSVAAAMAAGVDAKLPVAVVEKASLPQQRVTRAPLAHIVARCAEVGVVNPAIVVMGEVAREGFLAERTS